MSTVTQLHQHDGVPIAEACLALDLPRATYYRQIAPVELDAATTPRPTPARALGDDERDEILEVLDSQRFQDAAPRQVYAELLDEGRYVGHWRTMYRVLAANQQVRERRQAVRTPVAAPQLEATAPCQVWSWDITKLRGPRGVFFHLYVILDIFSRYVVGWTLARKECKHLAAEFIEATCDKQDIEPGQLTLHADRGASMRSGCVAELLDTLGVERSHSRPRVSDDNPFSEAQFKTLKYVPEFPDRFADEADARSFLVEFFGWYNEHHRHSGIALLTPSVVHHGQVDQVLAERDAVLASAYQARPDRFVNGPPQAPRPPSRVWIGPRPNARQPADPVSEPPPEAPSPVTHDDGVAALAGAVQGAPAGASAALPGRGRERSQAVVVAGDGASCHEATTGIPIAQTGRADPSAPQVQ